MDKLLCRKFQQSQQEYLVQEKKLGICNKERYIADMIKTFRDKWLETFFVDGTKNKKIPAIISERLFRKLQMLDDSTCVADLRSPLSNNFE